MAKDAEQIMLETDALLVDCSVEAIMIRFGPEMLYFKPNRSNSPSVCIGLYRLDSTVQSLRPKGRRKESRFR